MTRSRRWRKATLATLLGWAAGFVVTSPFQIVEGLRNSGPERQLLFSAVGYVLAVWLLITFAGVAIVWVCAVLPIALFVSGQWLLARRAWVIAASIVASLVAGRYKVPVWTDLY